MKGEPEGMRTTAESRSPEHFGGTLVPAMTANDSVPSV